METFRASDWLTPSDVDDGACDRVPDVIPAWVLEQHPVLERSGCACEVPLEQTPEPGWAIPGVTGLSREPVGLPPVSPTVAAAQSAIRRLCETDPAGLPAAQALADSEAMLDLEQQLRVHGVRRIADVAARGLHELVGYRSARTWLRDQRPDGATSDASLGQALRGFPVLTRSVTDGLCPLASARKVVHALRRCARHVDRLNGLIDGQPAADVMPAVVGHVVDLVAAHLLGVEDDDPRLLRLQQEVAAILAAGGTELTQLEATFTLLAQEIPTRHLTANLEELVLAVVPTLLDKAAEHGRDKASLSLTLKGDGSGWHLQGDLDLECGERLYVALGAEAARDPGNPADTQAWADARAAGTARTDRTSGTDRSAWLDSADLLAGLDPELRPRSKRRRLHDALSGLLERYLDTGLAGTAGKAPVQINVTLSEATVTGASGARRARGDSGALLPTGLVRRWWCDARITVYVLSLGGKALRTVHAQRTLTARERRALSIETGARCAGIGCCADNPDPLIVLRPHHARRYADDGSTSLDETLPVCDTLHHDLHEGGKTVRLRDGRYLNEQGFTPTPSLYDAPPF